MGARGTRVRIDEPASANGDDTGMMPTEAFLRLAGRLLCLAVAFAGRKRDIELPGLEVVVTAERAGTRAALRRLEVETRAELDEETLARLVERARPFCWVSNTLAEGVDVEYSHTSLDARFRK